MSIDREYPRPEVGAIAGAGLGYQREENARRIDKEKQADPWANRNNGMQCKTCIWFVEKQKNRIGTADSDVNPVKTIGRCRRHAPTMNGYPVVYMTDWCGDHRLDENKV